MPMKKKYTNRPITPSHTMRSSENTNKVMNALAESKQDGSYAHVSALLVMTTFLALFSAIFPMAI